MSSLTPEERTHIRRRLAELLPARESWRMIADDAGLEVGRIDSHVSPEARWRATLAEAERANRKVGDLQGEANCIRGNAEVARRSDQGDHCRALLEKALHLLEAVQARDDIAWTHYWLTQVTEETERDGHLERVLEIWSELDRPDLVDALKEGGGVLPEAVRYREGEY